jgi:hypothetical protein
MPTGMVSSSWCENTWQAGDHLIARRRAELLEAAKPRKVEIQAGNGQKAITAEAKEPAMAGA